MAQGRSLRAKRDGSAERATGQAGSPEPGRAWPWLPRHIPNKWERTGTKPAAGARPVPYTNAEAMLPGASSFPAPLYRGKYLGDLRVQLRELERQDGLSRVQHNVQRPGQLRQVPLHGRAHPSANAIALDRPSKHFAYRKTHARAVGTAALAIESDHISREMLFALLIDGLKIRVFEQARAPGELLQSVFWSFIHGWSGWKSQHLLGRATP